MQYRALRWPWASRGFKMHRFAWTDGGLEMGDHTGNYGVWDMRLHGELWGA